MIGVPAARHSEQLHTTTANYRTPREDLQFGELTRCTDVSEVLERAQVYLYELLGPRSRPRAIPRNLRVVDVNTAGSKAPATTVARSEVSQFLDSATQSELWQWYCQRKRCSQLRSIESIHIIGIE